MVWQIPGEWDPRSLLDPRDRPEQGDCRFYNDEEGIDGDEVQVLMAIKIEAEKGHSLI